jgi:hypothetical protein
MDRNIDFRMRKRTQEQINQLIGHIVDDKMSKTAASKKANMSCATGSKYYRQYLNAQKRNVPARRTRAVSASKNKE